MEKVKKKVLILGSTGMLGHIFHSYLAKNTDYEIIDLVFRTKLTDDSIICDVTDKKKLKEIIIKTNPDVIVNCIGVLIKGSTNDPSNAIYINSYLPHYLLSITKEINSKLIHVSTDCVFSGKKGSYVESDFRDADDVYGRSKALGELMTEEALTIRTSIIGPEIKKAGEGLLHWFLNQKGTIGGYAQAFWGGVTTFELSKAILIAIEKDIKGLIHLTNGIAINKYDLLNLFKQEFNRIELDINSVSNKKVDKSLKSERTDFGYIVPSYKEMISQMHLNMIENKSLYKENYTF